jgi:hypothetical protein
MSKQATATFKVKNWDEKPVIEGDEGTKLTRVSVSKSFHGDIEGEGMLEYLIFHHESGSADFIGMERVVGRIGDRSGSFVLQHSGTFGGGTATAKWFVVSGSGTGELRGLHGAGGFSSAHAEEYPMTFEYDIE